MPTYPQMVNISEVFNLSRPRNTVTIPQINSRHYLNSLAMHVASEISLTVMVVVGPKDSGKSEGISQMTWMWKEIGHFVLDLNLKGRPQHVKGEDVMNALSKELVEQLQVLDYDTYLHIHECVASMCLKNLSMRTRLVRWIFSNLTFCMTGIVGAIATLFLGGYCSKIEELYKIKWAYRCFIAVLGIAGMFTISSVVVSIIFPYFIYETLQPIDLTLRNGDWETTICYLNCIATEQPQNRPVLIIREIINFDSDTLHKCLRAMEKAKEKQVSIPIILETSDSLWYQVPAVKRSRFSFHPYYIREMLFEEGEHDMVKNNGLWTPEEYNMIYKILGGHTGSYQELWHTIKISNGTISDAFR